MFRPVCQVRCWLVLAEISQNYWLKKQQQYISNSKESEKVKRNQEELWFHIWSEASTCSAQKWQTASCRLLARLQPLKLVILKACLCDRHTYLLHLIFLKTSSSSRRGDILCKNVLGRFSSCDHPLNRSSSLHALGWVVRADRQCHTSVSSCRSGCVRSNNV